MAPADWQGNRTNKCVTTVGSEDHLREREVRPVAMGRKGLDLCRPCLIASAVAGIPADHAERALGYTMAGVRGTYDRHEYAAEKKQAFGSVAALIDRIANPQANVVSLAAARSG